ncbi:MAG: transglycosylase SLT domain-containing protein [Candidatus Hydrogenedentes bacterium]|nr:transglycosylase SLT domain-containing protein [Candidatus Hydrogenedentota bacterium]
MKRGGNFAVSLAVLLVVLGMLSVSSADSDDPSSGQALLKEMLAAIGEARPAMQTNESTDGKPQDATDNPLWPYRTFLQAESDLAAGEKDEAARKYAAIVFWASRPSHGDDYGAIGLASIALWRSLVLLNENPKPDRELSGQMLGCVSSIHDSKASQGMYRGLMLPSLPQVEEDTLRQAAVLAWKTGERDRAQRLFLDYLSIARTDELEPLEREIIAALVSTGVASPERLKLFQARRLFELGQTAQTSRLLREIYEGPVGQARAEAAFYLAQTVRIQQRGAWREESQVLISVAVDQSSDPKTVQEALFRRAIWAKSTDTASFKRDLERLVETFPNGSRTDDALHQLGMYHFEQDQIEECLKAYESLRAVSDNNDYEDSAHFVPAMALYQRQRPGDLESACDLLLRLNELRPGGPFYGRALFWLGRIHEELGQRDTAEKHFRTLIEALPYDFHALRARLHLALQPGASAPARERLWLPPDVEEEIRSRYRESRIEPFQETPSAYHARIRQALDSGLYQAGLSGETTFTKSFPSQRLEEVPLTELDKQGLTPCLSVVLSLRQDAIFAARSAGGSAPEEQPMKERTANCLRVVGAVAQVVQDWPLVMALIGPFGDIRRDERGAVQNDPHYLATAYAPVDKELVMAKAHAYSRPGTLESEHLAELLYSVARRESRFYPAALSPMHALGLFQFMPRTFEDLNKKWGLLTENRSAAAFLLNKDLQYDLAARYFMSDVLPRYPGEYGLLFAIMDHNAGAPAVKNWMEVWKNLGRDKDVEYMVDTIWYGETRILVTGILTDMMIVTAAGIYRE